MTEPGVELPTHAHRQRPRLGINAWKKSGGMGAAVRGSGRRGGWFAKQVGSHMKSFLSRGRLERGQPRLIASGPTRPFADDRMVKVVLPPMLNLTAHKKKMTWTVCLSLVIHPVHI
jgi:hypothetical protein